MDLLSLQPTATPDPQNATSDTGAASSSSADDQVKPVNDQPAVAPVAPPATTKSSLPTLPPLAPLPVNVPALPPLVDAPALSPDPSASTPDPMVTPYPAPLAAPTTAPESLSHSVTQSLPQSASDNVGSTHPQVASQNPQVSAPIAKHQTSDISYQDILNKDVLELLGASELPTEQKAVMYQKMLGILQNRVIMRIDDLLDEADTEGWKQAVDTGNMQTMQEFLESKAIDFPQLLVEEAVLLKSELVDLASPLQKAAQAASGN